MRWKDEKKQRLNAYKERIAQGKAIQTLYARAAQEKHIVTTKDTGLASPPKSALTALAPR